MVQRGEVGLTQGRETKTSLVTDRNLVLNLSHREAPEGWEEEFAALTSI